MNWYVASDEFLYVDPDESTDERIVGCAYSALDGSLAAGQRLQGRLVNYADKAPYMTETAFTVPCDKVIPSATFANADGNVIKLPPWGLPSATTRLSSMQRRLTTGPPGPWRQSQTTRARSV